MRKTTYAVAAVVVVALVVALGVRFASARTAENRCTDEADRRGETYVTQSWSWSPPGTTCTFGGGDGGSETRLFW